MDRTFVRALVVVAVSALAVAGAACTEGGDAEPGPGGTPSGSRSEACRRPSPRSPRANPSWTRGATWPRPSLPSPSRPPRRGTAPRTSPGSSFWASSTTSRTRSSTCSTSNRSFGSRAIQVIRGSSVSRPMTSSGGSSNAQGWRWSARSPRSRSAGSGASKQTSACPRMPDVLRSTRARSPRRACCSSRSPGSLRCSRSRRGWPYRITVLPDVAGETVTLLYTDYAQRFDDRIEAADEVVRSIEFDV